MQNYHDYDAGAVMLDAVNADNISTVENAITNFKQYIKRNLVDLDYAPAYVTFLINTHATRELSVLSFSTLCHLIKRISIQDPAVLEHVFDPVVPFLLHRLADHKDSIRTTALKSLKTCIDSCASRNIDIIMQYLLKDGLMTDDPQVQVTVIDVLTQIIDPDSNLSFSFKPVLLALVKLLKSQNFTVSSKSGELLKFYFTEVNPNNNTAKSDLFNDLVSNDVPEKILANLLKSIDASLYKRYAALGNSEQSSQTTNSASNLDRLNFLLDQTPNWNIDDSSLSSLRISENINYENMLSEAEIHFEGKETEKNWKNRQLLIVKVRQILRGESFLADIDSSLAFLRQFRDCITKGMLSLRTTLSNNACQLCKELAIFFGSFLDFTFIEPLLLTLLKLTSARKIMQHQNANVAVIAILLYTNLNPKIFTILNATIQDKNIQPRVYVGNWIRLILMKYYDPKNLDNFHFLVESIEGIMLKGISDPIPQVKDAMRNAFWTLCEFDSSYESKITKKLDPTIVKALERSKSVYLNNNNIKFKQLPRREVVSDRAPDHEKEKQKGPNDLCFRNIREQNKQMEKENIQLLYEPIRKSVRSESLDETKPAKRKQHALRHHTVDANPASNIIEPTHINTDDSVEEFTGRIKRENIIYEEITSDSKSLQAEGFNKLLHENDSSLTIKFHGALNNLTILNTELFNVIFMDGNEKFFRKITSYLSTENILRLFCMYLIKSENYARIDFVINELSLEDFCLSIINILNLSVDTSKIDNINLSIQYIKNRFKIIKSILKIFSRLIVLKKNIIKSYLLASIFECLFLSFGIVDDESIKEEYISIFNMCLHDYNDLFCRSLSEIDDITLKKNICFAINLPDEKTDIADEADIEMAKGGDDEGQDENKTKFLSPFRVDAEELDENIDGMTKVIPKMKSFEEGSGDGGEPPKNLIVSDLTMILPKHKGSKLFDFENVELKHEEPDHEMSVGVEEVISQLEQDELNTDMEEVEELEKAVKAEKNKATVESGREVATETTEESALIAMKEPPDDKEAFTEDIQDASMVEKEKSLMSDSTPDMNQLTIDENREIGGYLGLVIQELLEYESAEELTEEDTFNDIGKFSWVLKNADSIDHRTIYDKLVKQLKGEYKIECLAVLRYFYDLCPEYLDASIIGTFNEVFNHNIPTDELFLAVLEITELADIKMLVGIGKIHALHPRLQEAILRCILNKMKDDSVDCEDIFMIERIVNRGCEHDDSFIRMNSYLVYKEMYRMFLDKACDSQGVELVDSVTVDSMRDQIKQFCGVSELE